ncbi:MAG: AAA family ATPase [Phycicoccus sp.]
MTDALIASLSVAVDAAPHDMTLRRHLAALLVDAGRDGEAVVHCATLLAADPRDDDARALMARALGPAAPAGRSPSDDARPARRGDDVPPATPAPASSGEFDWRSAEDQVGDIAQPMFVSEEGTPLPEAPAWDVEHTRVTLADVGGMTNVKERLDAAFLAPMRNPELRRLYGKSLKGGLLLYGPPGCGKTFIARAVAGELGAAFMPVGINDVLDMYIGNSETNLHEIFQLARRNAPCVVFLDEIDALGQKRSMTRNSAMRTSVNQLLTELDGVDGLNEGVFVLAATNQPWDVDPALRRPGRFDRTLLVLPPDEPARAAILTYHLRDRPIEGIDTGRIAKGTDGFSGADLAHVCDTAAERALLDGVRTGDMRMIQQRDLDAAVREVRPSIGPWLESARTVVQYGTDDGTFAELRGYLKKRRLW